MDRHAKILFTIAALFNVSIGLTWLFAMPWFVATINMQPVPNDPVFIHLSAVVVLTFGWGYWRIAQDPVAHRNIIHLGIAGKTMVVMGMMYDFFTGATNWTLPLLVGGDAIFAMLFANYLRLRPLKT